MFNEKRFDRSARIAQLALALALLGCAISVPSVARAQADDPGQSDSGGGIRGFLQRWAEMAERSESRQPNWLTPIAITSARLKQEFRYDAWRQTTPADQNLYTVGAGKGIEFLAAPRLGFTIGVPSYVFRAAPRAPSGFGDLSLTMKLRLASAPVREGNYLVTLLLGATAPTGSRSIGTHDGVVSPGLGFGKGWRNWDVQASDSIALPTGHTALLGRQFTSNTAVQYRAAWKLWPELEINSTSYLAGTKNQGRTQAFLTPGIGFGHQRLCKNRSFSIASGLQIAATHFHTYDHRWLLSLRLQ